MNFWRDILTALLIVFTVMLKKSVQLLLWPREAKRKDVRGEIALITGGGSGIGRQLALRFAKLGCRVVLWDINEAGLKETKDLIAESGGKSFAYKCDVSDRKKVYEVADKVKQEVGLVTILVNNAGIVNGKQFMDLSDEKIIKVMEVNSMAIFWTHKAFLPQMMALNKGHSVTICSIAGGLGFVGLSDYAASKHAALGFHETLSNEIKFNGFNGIKTTIVCPSLINTGLFTGSTPKVIDFLNMNYVADEIIDGVLKDKHVVYLPKWLYFVHILKVACPPGLAYTIADKLHLHEVMATFVGRKKITSS